MPAAVWDPAADRKLFLAILKDQNVKVDSKSIAAAVASDGLHVTPRAIEERLKKLKKMDSEGNGLTSDADGTPAGKIKAKATPRLKKATPNEDGDNDEDDERPTPSKKARKVSMKKPKRKRDDSATPADDCEGDAMFSDIKVETLDEI